MNLYQRFIAWVRDEDSPGLRRDDTKDSKSIDSLNNSSKNQEAVSENMNTQDMGEISGTVDESSNSDQERRHNPHHFGKIVFPIEEITAAEKPHREKEEPLLGKHSVFYIRFLSVLFTVAIAFILLVMVADSPVSGTRENNPTLNEVSQRYIEKGVEDTGATNFVAGIILDYRAFDTFGEAAMVFTSAIGVIILLRDGKHGSKNKSKTMNGPDTQQKGEKQTYVSLSRR